MIVLNKLIFLGICSLVVTQSPFRPKTESGDFCKIPFENNGKVYHSCTTEGDSKPWCKNSQDSVAYCANVPDFSSCNVAPPNSGVSEVQGIIDLVNNIRSKESALRMAKLRWNSELAQRAQYMSDQCQVGSDDRNLCSSKSPMGQISFMSMSSDPQPRKWNQFILEFFNQKPSYNYDTNECSGKYCNGYKQLVNAKTTDIGCAITSCNRDGVYSDYYFCNFYPPVYMDKPYEKGDGTCNQCYKLDDKYSYKCTNNLCEICDSASDDCKGKEELKKEVESGAACEDLDASFCKLNEAVCPNIDLLPADQKEMMKSKCKKTCSLC